MANATTINATATAKVIRIPLIIASGSAGMMLAKNQRLNSQQGGAAHQLAGHQEQARTLGHTFRWHDGEIDKNARQIKQPGKPAGDEDDVK